jgi:hypothetical protein
VYYLAMKYYPEERHFILLRSSSEGLTLVVDQRLEGGVGRIGDGKGEGGLSIYMNW